MYTSLTPIVVYGPYVRDKPKEVSGHPLAVMLSFPATPGKGSRPMDAERKREEATQGEKSGSEKILPRVFGSDNFTSKAGSSVRRASGPARQQVK